LLLGLDISSSTIGYSLLDEQSGEISRYGFVDIRKTEKDLFEKVHNFFFMLDDLKFDKVCIEESLSSFSFGKTTTNTIILLAKINAMISYIIFDKFKIKPEYINVSHARKLIGLTIKKKSKKFPGIKIPDTKDQVFEFINKSNDFIWFYNKKDSLDNRCLDASDAIVIAKAEFIRCSKISV